MSEKEKSNKAKSKEKNNRSASNKKHKKKNKKIKRPKNPFIQYSEAMRSEHKEKLSVKELGEMWKKLPEDKKKPYIDKFEAEKIVYEKSLDALGNCSDDSDDSGDENEKIEKKNEKKKAKTSGKDQKKNNLKECQDCKKGGKK